MGISHIVSYHIVISVPSLPASNHKILRYEHAWYLKDFKSILINSIHTIVPVTTLPTPLHTLIIIAFNSPREPPLSFLLRQLFPSRANSHSEGANNHSPT
jgi:hypothetical protein